MWSHLLEPLERVGWVSGIILVLVDLFTWIVGNVEFEYRVAIGLAAVIVLGLTAGWSRISRSRKEKSQIAKVETPTPTLPPVEAQFRLEPPVSLENIPEPERSRIITEVVPKSGHVRSQQVYVKAIDGDLTDCEVKVVVDGNGVDHVLWEGIRRQLPSSAKDKVTIHRDDEKYFTLWYAHQKDGKEYLYIPITTFPHMTREIRTGVLPLTVDVWIIASGFSGKRHRFIIYRESWDGVLAKQVGEDGRLFAEFDANWHLSGEVQPVPPFGSQDMRGSDKASTLHISHRGKEISLTARMRYLKPSCQYRVEIGPPYTAGRLIREDNIGGSRTIFKTDQNGEADWSFTLSADELATRDLRRFSVWVGDVPMNATVLLSDNISFHN